MHDKFLRTRLHRRGGNFQDDRRLHFGWRGRAVRRQTGGKNPHFKSAVKRTIRPRVKFNIIRAELNSIYRGCRFAGQILNPYSSSAGIGLVPMA